MEAYDAIPGLREAEAADQAARERAYLGVPLDLCGVEVLPLTLRRVRNLVAGDSPFLIGGVPTEGSIGAFLWALSPDFSFGDELARAAFISRLVAGGALEDLAGCVAAIREFMFEMYADRPPTSDEASNRVSFTTFDAAIVHSLAIEYHWTEEAILDCPLPRVWLYLTHIRLHHDPKAPRMTGARRRRLVGDYLRARQAEQEAQAAAEQAEISED
ncbi:MAG: hypothetical protein INR62_04890 [Rhodospirillales bacterium]|nr:hypothetical protein [Acetobacter sp.]